MNKLLIPDEIKQQLKLSINNIRFLMYDILDNCLKDHRQRIYDVFKKKIKSYVCMMLNWYKTYSKNIPDAFLMLIDQETKVNKLKELKNNRIQILNYDIQQEMYHFMTRIYNLYPNR